MDEKRTGRIFREGRTGEIGIRPNTEDMRLIEPKHGKNPTQPHPSTKARDPYLGRVLASRYRVVERLGSGGSALVYRIRPTWLERDFAVKIISIVADNDLDWERKRTHIVNEISTLSRLRNPHVVRIYEVFQLDQERVGIVMDVVNGRTLDELIRAEGPLSLERTLSILRQVAHGLHAAHEVGIVHRDVKPANIMVESLSLGGDFAYVLDFGTVKQAGQMMPDGRFQGTPLFASPEQVRSEGVDQRCDIYALGAIVYAMLTGNPPFQGPSTMAILLQHLLEDPPSLAAALSDTRIPRRLDDLVGRMMAKSPGDRPRDLWHVVRELDLIEIALRQGLTAPAPAAAVVRRNRGQR